MAHDAHLEQKDTLQPTRLSLARSQAGGDCLGLVVNRVLSWALAPQTSPGWILGRGSKPVFFRGSKAIFPALGSDNPSRWLDLTVFLFCKITVISQIFTSKFAPRNSSPFLFGPTTVLRKETVFTYLSSTPPTLALLVAPTVIQNQRVKTPVNLYI